MKKNPTVKIMVVYHKPAALLKSDVFVPIQGGRSIEKELNISDEDRVWMHKYLMGDNSGDNVSNKKIFLNEMSSVYWAWKNQDKLGNPDYIGLMHYRRHLCFDLANTEEPDQYGLLYADRLDRSYLDKYQLDDKSIKKIVGQYDVVVAEKLDMCRLGTKTPYNHYKTADPKLHIEDLDYALQILYKKYPEYKESAEAYLNGPYGYFTNIFIMKKELFGRYCSWLFDILAELEKLVDPRQQNEQEIRILGYISEWLWGIFLTHQLRTQKDLRVKELKRTFVRDTSVPFELTPRIPTEISIVCASSAEYAPYLSVTLQSLIEHSNCSKAYTLYILERNMSEQIKRILRGMEQKHFKIRFVDVSSFMHSYEESLFFVRDHLSIETYYRLFIPYIFSDFQKVIYCDCDAVFLEDAARLYQIPLDTYLFGAAVDTEVNRQIKVGDTYYQETLHLSQPKQYVQGGLLVCNIPAMKQFQFTEKCLCQLHQQKPRYADQDIINEVCAGKIKFLPKEWNVENHLMIFQSAVAQQLPWKMLQDYYDALKQAKYLHFSGGLKPWMDPASFNACVWWKFAHKTPFYETILQRCCNQGVFSKEIIKDIVQYKKLYWKYALYHVKSKVTWGKRRKRYQDKTQILHEKIRRIREWLK